MTAASTFYNKTTLLPLVNHNFFAHRTIHATSRSTSSRGTYLSISLKVIITQRFGSGAGKFPKPVSDGINKAVTQIESSINSEEASTTSPVQGSNSMPDNAIPSTTEVFKPDETDIQTKATMANQTALQSNKQVEDKVKQAVQDSYNKDKEPIKKPTTISKEAALEQDKHLADNVTPLSTPSLDALKKQGFNLTDESPTGASSSKQDSKPNTTINTNKMIDAYLSKHSIVQNQSTQGQSKGSTTSNTSTQPYSSSYDHTNSVSHSNNTEESFNSETSSKDIPNPPIPETIFTEQSMLTDSNLTSSSFNEDSESVKETEDLAQKALEMKLIARRDAPNNPHAGIEHMTVKGNSLYTELQMKEHPQLSQNPIDLSNTTFQTGILTIDENQTLIPRSDQTHPVITSDNGKILVWGYLTSHDSDNTVQIANKQMDGAKTPEGKDKPQFYNPFKQPVEVSPENFIRNHAGDTYLEDPEITEQLRFYNSKASNNEPSPYKETGVTKEDLHVMVAKQSIDEGEKAFEEEKKPSNFKTDDDKKKKKKSEEDAKKNKEKQIKQSQEKKAKAQFNAENKPKAPTHDN